VTRVAGPNGRSSESGGRYMRNSPNLITMGLAFSLLGSTCALARPTLNFEKWSSLVRENDGSCPDNKNIWPGPPYELSVI
jgi:hypothetical protein